MLLLWPILEVTEALEKLKKLLETLKDSKYTLCNIYCNIINMLLSYYVDQTGTGRGKHRIGRGRGIETISLLNSNYICDRIWENVNSSHIQFCSFGDS